MNRRLITVIAVALVGVIAFATAACTQDQTRRTHSTLFIGVDASGSFKNSGYYDNALSFLAHYIYGHLNGLGEMEKPHSLFVGSIDGSSRNRTSDPASCQRPSSFSSRWLSGS